MTSVLCKILNGDTDASFRTVEIKSSENRSEFVQVPVSFLREDDGEHYLAVAVVGQDRGKRVVLIQLPFEADSGVNRLWVPESSVLQDEEVLR